jgi:catechol 2,3-dioxygenase-like lactoylglutathione lyase family enzyme
MLAAANTKYERSNPMLKKRPIIAFVATTAPTRAKKFYADTLGLRLVSEDAFALVFDAGGTMLRVATVQELHPAGYTVLGWIVPDIHRAVPDLVSRGVVFRRYDGLVQDDQGVWTSPSGAEIAWFEDPDGNTLSLTEFSKRPNRGLQPKGASRKVRGKSRRRRGR